MGTAQGVHRFAVRLTVVSALAFACLFGSAGQARATVLDGNGMWVWEISNSGGSAAAIAKQARAYKLDAVFVKSGDGDNYWTQFSAAFVRELKASGLTVCAWQYVYGSDPRGEARAAAAAVDAGADCLVIDAESEYEGKYSAAQVYVETLRELVGPDYPLALTGFPYVDYHPTFPYSVFLAPGAAQFNIPQVYWRAIGVSVEDALEHTYRYNRPYGAPIYPLGQTWQDPPRQQVIDFRRLSRAYGADGVSWWSWQETAGREWTWVSKSLGSGKPPVAPAKGYARLATGSTGDLVLWAQQLLVAAGLQVKPDGTLGRGTAAEIAKFQTAKGLTPSGVINARTWRALLSYTDSAAPVRWTARREARVVGSMRAAQPPAVRLLETYDGPLTVGRP